MNSKQQVLIGICIIVMATLAVGAYGFSKSQEMPKQDGSVCTMDYQPVCGVDGITYGNPCMAGETDIAHDGECQAESQNAGGTFLAGSEIPDLTDEELAAS